jgi:hypothetical protein
METWKWKLGNYGNYVPEREIQPKFLTIGF